jgi:hypothetical protein
MTLLRHPPNLSRQADPTDPARIFTWLICESYDDMGLLVKLVGKITLKRGGDRLVAELRGNLPAILELEEELYNRGAGRGIWSLPNIGGVLELTLNLPLRTALVRRTTSAG